MARKIRIWKAIKTVLATISISGLVGLLFVIGGIEKDMFTAKESVRSLIGGLALFGFPLGLIAYVEGVIDNEQT